MSDWQLDRLPGDVRQEAENAAQRDGLPLHRWLGKLIRETCEEEGIPPGRELIRVVSNGTTGNGHRRQQPAMPPRSPAEPIRVPPQARAAETAPQPVERPIYRNGNGNRQAAQMTPPAARPAEPVRAQEPPRQPLRPLQQAARQPTSSDEAAFEQTQRQPLARGPIPREPAQPAQAPIAPPREPARVQEPPRRSTRIMTAPRDQVVREQIARASMPSAPPPAAEPEPPIAPPAAASAPPQSVSARLSTISSQPTAAPAATPIARGVPPMAPQLPTMMPSRFAVEPRPAPSPPRQEMPAPARTPFAPSPVASAPPAAQQPAPPPVVPRSDDRLATLTKLVHGLRRNELSPIGEARLFLKLMTEHMASIGDITVATGRTKEQVARSLRLLGLSDRLRDLIDRGALSREQAFALLDLDNPDAATPVVPPSSGHRLS